MCCLTIAAPGGGSLVADERALISEIRTRALALKNQAISADVSVGAPRHDKNDANTSAIAKSATPVPSAIAADFIVPVTVLSLSDYDV